MMLGVAIGCVMLSQFWTELRICCGLGAVTKSPIISALSVCFSESRKIARRPPCASMSQDHEIDIVDRGSQLRPSLCLPWSTPSSLKSVPRGGSIMDSDEQEDVSFLVRKVRNMVRSLLDLGDRKASVVGSMLRRVVRSVEKLTGVSLLPVGVKVIASEKDTGSRAQKLTPTKKSTKRTRTKKMTGKGEENAIGCDSLGQPSSQKRVRTTALSKARRHTSNDINASSPSIRVQRELKAFLSSPPPNIRVNVGKNICIWIITLHGAKGTVYESETYRLRVAFPQNYPSVPPSVYFLKPTPRHEHVYTNGDICLSLLGKDWRPTMTAQSIAVSILSILSSAKKKSLPMDNSRVAGMKPGLSQDNWVYHDDNC